ncbi:MULTISPECIES: gluconeogenesis factor YvcK family protein [Planktothrix]|nr:MULTISPECIES: gluconeogenesis factor YvcK family protein [Planktothrix]
MSTGSFKHTFRKIMKLRLHLGLSNYRSHRMINQWFKWLSPGLFIKRWMAVSATGVLVASLGLAISTGMTPIYYILQLLKNLLGWITTVVPNYISGPLMIALGVVLVLWSQTRSLNSISEAFYPAGDEQLVDRLLSHRRLLRGPKIVGLGGGTGLSTLLRGLKEYSANITAIVTVADDGGSSGRLRREMGVLPPGDIRNCIAALADEERLLTELFQYRFTAGDGLTGHSFGNLFLTAMSEIEGDLEQAIAASSKVLAIRGQVLPATLTDVNLWAKLADGRRIHGESSITEAKGKILTIGCIPPNPPALPKAVQAILEADLIIIGPGSLYTSVIPNLLVPEIAAAIASRNVPRIYICNIMTQPGETDDYTVSDHIKAIDKACGYQLFDAVLTQGTVPPANALIRYAQEDSHPVILDRDLVKQLGRRIVMSNVMDVDPDTGYLRHDPYRLAQVLLRWFGKNNP